jgi:DNA repair protein RecO (recombination protein O)
MDWQDQGIVLAARRHGESSAIVTLFTRARGRHLGLARGGSGRRAGGLYQKGNLVAAHWRARLAEHLGNYSCELIEPLGLSALDDAPRLEAVVSALAVLELTMAEREVHAELFDATVALLRRLATAADEERGWAADYVRWERRCLADLGFGLDLETCAVTGVREDLRYVSPRSGRAVSASAGAPLAEKLLPLPAFLLSGDTAASPADIRAGLELTQFFLERHVLSPHGHRLRAARVRLLDGWRRLANLYNH